MLIVLVLAVLASLNFVAFVGLLERWKRRRETSVRERSIRRHPDLVSELYQLHDRIETVVYRRAADKPSLALNVVEIMNVASPSNPNGPEDFREKFEMVQRQSPYGTLSSPASAVGGTGVIMRRGRFQNGSAAR